MLDMKIEESKDGKCTQKMMQQQDVVFHLLFFY